MNLKRMTTLSSLLVCLSVSLLSLTAWAEKNPSSGGTVTYIEDKGEEEVMDPENPSKEIRPSDGVKNTSEGSLRVDFMSNLRITNAPITIWVGEYYANPTKVQPLKKTPSGPVAEGSEEERGNFIQITDKRAVKNGKPAGWNLSAKLTKQFQSTSGILNGAAINISTPHISSTSNTEQIAAKSFKLEGDGSGGERIVKANPDHGWGTYIVQYGRPKDNTMKKAIKLIVPAGTPLEATKYTAEITWTLSELPIVEDER